MNRLKMGMLGCGGIAQRHAQTALKMPDELELVAVADCSEPKARAFSERYTGGRARVFADHRALLDQTDLDLLAVCLPPFAHTDEVPLAAERGIHLLVEKPIALKSEDGWRMVEAVERARVKTQVGFMYRFGVAMQEFKARFDLGAVGAAGLFSARYFCNSAHADWKRTREQSGGQLVEQIIHLFDTMRYLLGEPVSVFSRQANFFHREIEGYTAEDVSATVFGFPNGGLGVIYATNGAFPNRWIKEWRIVAQNLVAEFTDWNHATFTPTDAPERPAITIASVEDVFVLQLRDLVNAIRTNGETRTPLREGAKSLDLVLAAARSAEIRTELAL